MPASQSTVTQSLIRHDAKQFLLDNCGEIYQEWTSLLAKTTLPAEATSSDQRILDMLLTLDVAFNTASQRIIRLASIQLTRVLKGLKEKVKEDRRRGLIDGQRSKRDASIVIDIYCRATGKPRALVLSNTRFANRCSALAKDSLLAIILTDHDAKLIKNTSISISRLQAIAEEITRAYPPELILALNYLSNDGSKIAGDESSLMLVRRIMLA
ncbi:hypothetical protein MANI_027773 [Metarhizium anisopliae]